MLAAKINNEWVDMYPNTRLKYVYNSPAFSDSPIVGDFSYPLSFPLTNVNKNIFGFLQRADINEETKEYPCELYDNNILIISGNFKVSKSDKLKITGNLINSAYHFINLIKNKTTKDLDLGGTITPANLATYFATSFTSGYPTYSFARFPILNEVLFNDTVVESDWADKLYINSYNPISDSYVLFPYLAYVIDQIFDTFDYSISNAIADHTELVKLCLINIFNDTSLFSLTPNVSFNLLEHIVKCDLTKLLGSINKTLATAFFFDFRQQKADMIFLKDLLSSTDYDDWTDKVISGPEKAFNYEDKGFFLSYEWDSTDESISEKQLEDGILDNITPAASVLTPDDLPAYGSMGSYAGEVRYVTAESAYYIIRNMTPPPGQPVWEWDLFTWDLFGKTVGDGLNEKPTKLSTLGMSWHEKKKGSYLYDWLTPDSNQQLFKNPEKGIKDKSSPGSVYGDCIAQYVNDFEPRLLFYRGMQPDVEANDYPLGTSGKYDSQGTSIGSLTLNWLGSAGLYENFHKKWLDFRDNSEPVNFKVLLNKVDILNLNLARKKRIGSINYLIKKLVVDYPIKEAVVVTVYKV